MHFFKSQIFISWNNLSFDRLISPIDKKKKNLA